ncbi:MAG: CoA pyrophosphatase [Rhabdaerophilum calidifontis]
MSGAARGADAPDRLTRFRADAARLLLPAPVAGAPEPAPFGCHVIAGLPLEPDFIARAKPAAVLCPVVARPGGATILLTERAAHLSNHAGQVAFPGGRIEPGESVAEAALREAEEEIGLARDLVTPLGYLPPYYSGTGYRIETLVVLVAPELATRPDPAEVARVFEVPLGEALDLDRYRTGRIFFRGRERQFYILDHPGAYIWGVTAGIMRSLAERIG